MNSAKTYQGGCHCGAVRYSVTLDLKEVMACNCSICSKTGTLLTFTPAESFTLHQGQDSVGDYQFNRHTIHHLFCRTCGIRSFARGTGSDGTQMVAINARCLDGVDAEALSVRRVDGRSL